MLLRRLRWNIPVALTALMTIAECDHCPAQYRPSVGEVHVDFVLPRIDDREPVALSQFRGRKVLLIHFASW